MLRYNPQTPIAVFLGPSLSQAEASQLLAANYYPPARMGDIYRLLGSGVRLIVLIDGLFHSTASVWQRELLEALDNNILVIGAASMGALRAAELYPFGMVGYGTIFEWYQAGMIDGDDEVVLSHADERLNFRPLSEPLVNIRYNLARAVARGHLSSDQALALIEDAKKSYYADRSYRALLNNSLIKTWPSQVQWQLAQFIQGHAVNLKSQDASGALKHSAEIAKTAGWPSTDSLLPRSQDRYYRLTKYRRRGFVQADSFLVSGESLLAKILKDEILVETLRPALIKNFFIGLWAKQRQIICPPDYAERYRQAWQNDRIKGELRDWLQANGLTYREFQTTLSERALLSWLIEQGPAFFGVEVKSYLQFGEVLLSQSSGQPAHLFSQLMEICYLANWAAENGVACPPGVIEKFVKRWEQGWQIQDRNAWLVEANLLELDYLSVLAGWACCDWLMEKGPLYFGYRSWSFEVELLKELQLSGRAAQLVTTFSTALVEVLQPNH